MLKSDLLLSQEFNAIKKFFFSSEQVQDLIVGEVNDYPHLFVLTNQRVFLKMKENSSFFGYEQFGLEEIIDVKAMKVGKYTDLTFFIKNKEFIKINYVENNHAIDFINLLLKCRDAWIEKI